MKAIVTKYLPATDTKPSRIKAKAEGVASLTVSYDGDGNGHARAAIALCRRMGWKGTLIAGGMPDQSGECFVFAESDSYAIGAA